MKLSLLAPTISTLLLAGCVSSGGVADNTDLVNHWNGMHVDQVSKLWGKPVATTPDPNGTRYAWAYHGCQINALVRDEYVVEINTRASDPDACNIVFARSRPQG